MRTGSLAALLLLTLTACTGAAGPAGAPGAAGKGLAQRTTAIPPGATCAAGGSQVEAGVDDDADLVLDDAEVDSTVVLCNGSDGQPVAAAPEAAGANCPSGGVKVTPPGGAPAYVCSGAAGESVTITAEPPGASCPYGGQQLQVGAGAPTWVCNGAPGAAGDGVSMTVEPPGAACPYGGQKLQVGAGVPSYVCHGEPGATGAAGEGVSVTAEPPGASCPSGGQKLQVGAGAPTWVCNGAPGAAGQDGLSVTMTPEPPGTHCGLGGVRLQVGSGPASYLCSGAPAGATLPTVSTAGARSVRYAEATIDGEVTAAGGELIFARGVVLADHPSPSLGDDVRFASAGTGPFATRCEGLAPATTYWARAFATNALGTSYGEERSFTTLALTVPALATLSPANVTDSTAYAGGDVLDDGGLAILARGACWAATADPGFADACVAEGAEAGRFLVLLTALPSSSTLHVRAYATNALGTSFGQDEPFTTQAAPLATVTTAAAADVAYTTATGGGAVVDDHGAPVTSRGVCWATTPTPTTSGTCASQDGGLGAFTVGVTGLTPATTYHLRAFAVNAGGTSYGPEVTFTTLAMSLPALTTRSVFGVSSWFAGSGGTIATDGGSPITAKGVCWSVNPAPTVANAKTSDGAGSASFTSTLTGLSPLTGYHVRAYATNALGTAYGDDLAFTTTDLVTAVPTVPVVGTATSTITGSSTASSGGYVSNDGGSTVTARGVCWSTAQTPTLADSCSSDGGSGVGAFQATITGLGGCHVVYYVRAYATNATGTGYGTQNTVSTGLLPAVTTAPVTAIGTSSATSGGVVADDGGCAITQKGVTWSWNPTPTLSALMTSDGTGGAPFVSSLTGLYGNRTYYVRAYATNVVGTTYGPQVVFTTAEPATLYLGQSYAGGIIFYLDGTGLHGLVAAPADLGYYTWGCYGTSIPTASTFGSGATNTAAIVASCGEASFAAKAADGLVLNGYADWFLPSSDEFRVMWTNLAQQGLGAFGGSYYWTSSEASPWTALARAPWDNDLFDMFKDSGGPVRAVRAF